MAELEIKLEKRPQNDRLAEANMLVNTVYEEMLNGRDEDVMQMAVNIQITVNRLVWLANKRMNEGVNDMPWMILDIKRLIELVENFCTPERCNSECPFWESGINPCLKETAYSLQVDYNSIRDLSIKFIKGIECYVTNDF